MNHTTSETSVPDEVLAHIADYAISPEPFSETALSTARLCLLDSLGCALLGLTFPACSRLIGPVVPGMTIQNGARIPGTSLELDPVQAAFCFGTMIRWLDYNDTWLAQEWGHPSDNLGAILMTADWCSRQPAHSGRPAFRVRDILNAMIRAYEIQGVLALENAFNRAGIDHVLLVRVASAAVATQMLGGNRDQVLAAVSQAWLDAGPLRTYRHAPNTGSRKSWAAGDATSRAVRLALLTLAGERGYATALTTPTWGFQDAVNRGRDIRLARPFGSYVIENILFKVSFPAEFHGQTAVEAALALHSCVKDRWDRIERICIETQEPAIRIISKQGPLKNPADRDHCLQYMIAVALIHGELTAAHYEADAASNPLIDVLRANMEVVERPQYSRDYLDPDKRSIANSIQVTFSDGEVSPRIEVEYPLGHRRRRDEARPALLAKFTANSSTMLSAEAVSTLVELFEDPLRLDQMPVPDFVQLTLRNATTGPGK
ncbi:MAG: bifunctional 2-methylcitrate dehydratase/aconitate hydratase [Planctomycetes bacterium]|nr:bifunctional 2-methylcitrate dehydratase/aconitate hydratase [Planctomycetota bacterium]